MYTPAMAILAGEPGDPVIILAATVVTVLGILVEPRLELTGVKAFFRFLPRPGFGAAGACDGTSVLKNHLWWQWLRKSREVHQVAS